MSDALALPSVNSPDAVISFVESLDSYVAEHRGKRVPLDLSSMPRPKWGAIFANLLAGRYADLALDIKLPPESRDRLKLARSNMLFALARHSDRHFRSVDADQMIERWLEDWEPADVLQPLVALPGLADTGTVPQTLGHNLVAFLNPDAYYNLARDRDAVLHPWLRKLLGKPRAEDRDSRDQLYEDISLSTFELLDNVQDHADLPEPGLCSLSLYTTSGGPNNKATLHISVWDNGQGMPATIEDQYQVLMHPTDMVEAALNGDMPHREADRGTGLNRVLELVNRVSGRLFVATGSANWRENSCVMVDHRGAAGVRARAESVAIPVQGTIVTLQIPLQAVVNDTLSGLNA